MDTIDLIKDVCLFGGTLPNERTNEVRAFLDKAQALQLQQTGVSGSLLLYDVEELNNIVNEFNNGEISLYDFIGRVWNKGYTLGCIDGSKYNDR